jgi:hypothetical protein
MSTITVYKNGKELTSETIKREYYIIETSAGELFWFEEELGRPVPGVLRI